MLQFFNSRNKTSSKIPLYYTIPILKTQCQSSIYTLQKCHNLNDYPLHHAIKKRPSKRGWSLNMVIFNVAEMIIGLLKANRTTIIRTSLEFEEWFSLSAPYCSRPYHFFYTLVNELQWVGFSVETLKVSSKLQISFAHFSVLLKT